MAFDKAKWLADRAERARQIAREASGEAKGFRYAIECGGGWLGPETRPGRLHDATCSHREAVVYEGDRESSQARAVAHRQDHKHSGCYHSPAIVPEAHIARIAAVRGWPTPKAT